MLDGCVAHDSDVTTARSTCMKGRGHGEVSEHAGRGAAGLSLVVGFCGLASA